MTWYSQTDRPQMKTGHMRIACRIPKATNTHSDYVTRTAFYGSNGCTNEYQFYIICTLPVLYYMQKL
jgi:hypothetical protein